MQYYISISKIIRLYIYPISNFKMSRFAALSLQNSSSLKRDESNNMKFNKVQLENKNILSPSNI